MTAEYPDHDLTEAELEEEMRLNSEHIEKSTMKESVGRVVLEHISAFNKAADENRDPDDLAVIDILKWLEKDLPERDRKWFAEETGYTLEPAKPDPDDIPF